MALVGRSGSGKSTIFNLLTRFYEPTEGSVSIDGRDLRTVTQESLRAQMGVVFQESLLFGGTILDNIRLGKPDATTSWRAGRVGTIRRSASGVAACQGASASVWRWRGRSFAIRRSCY